MKTKGSIHNICSECGKIVRIRKPSDIFLARILLTSKDVLCNICDENSSWEVVSKDEINVAFNYTYQVMNDLNKLFNLKNEHYEYIKEEHYKLIHIHPIGRNSLYDIVISFYYFLLKKLLYVEGYNEKKFLKKINQSEYKISKSKFIRCKYYLQNNNVIIKPPKISLLNLYEIYKETFIKYNITEEALIQIVENIKEHQLNKNNNAMVELGKIVIRVCQDNNIPISGKDVSEIFGIHEIYFLK